MALIGYLFLKYIRSGNIFGTLKKSLALLVVGIPAIDYFLWDRVMQGFTDPMGSANIKFRILSNYLQNSDIVTLLFGGTYDLHFDAEYGYWIGAAGVCGVVGWALALRMLIVITPSSRPILFAMLLMAIGNTVFFGLLTGAIATTLLVISCTVAFQTRSGKVGRNYPADDRANTISLGRTV